MKFLVHDSHSVESDKAGLRITVNYVPSWIGKLFGIKPKSRVFVGNCTVWHEIPGFQSPDVWMQSWLTNRWSEHRYYKGVSK